MSNQLRIRDRKIVTAEPRCPGPPTGVSSNTRPLCQNLVRLLARQAARDWLASLNDTAGDNQTGVAGTIEEDGGNA